MAIPAGTASFSGPSDDGVRGRADLATEQGSLELHFERRRECARRNSALSALILGSTERPWIALESGAEDDQARDGGVLRQIVGYRL